MFKLPLFNMSVAHGQDNLCHIETFLPIFLSLPLIYVNLSY